MTQFPYLLTTQAVTPGCGCPVSDALQRLIDENPNRAIFFPDGEYLLDRPLCTPADPRRSVSLVLSPYAVLRAAENFPAGEAMVRLGAIHPANDIRTPGSNYSFSGGILDGGNRASGISIDGGRETVVRYVSIKHVRIGLHIRHGANNGSSDADVSGVNIIGSGTTDSIGVLLEGYDNTLTNMRIADVFCGVMLRSSGNSLRNIHPLYTCDYTDYTASVGFDDRAGNNWYSFCYSDHFGVGFRNAPDASCIYTDCFTLWYCGRGGRHVAFRAEGQLRSVLTNFRIGFFNAETENVILEVGEAGGPGVFERLSVNTALTSDETYRDYLVGGMF